MPDALLRILDHVLTWGTRTKRSRESRLGSGLKQIGRVQPHPASHHGLLPQHKDVGTDDDVTA